jgi:hypothetical protein
VRDFRRATQAIDKLLSSFGFTRHLRKGEWVGSIRVDRLGCVVDSDRTRIYIASQKNDQGTWYLASYPPACTARAAMCFEAQITIGLWCLRLIVSGNALCSLLNQEFN